MSLDILLINGDLDFRCGLTDTRTSPALVAQHVEAMINIAVGEWLMDIRQGMPWVEMSLQKTRVSARIFRDAIAGVLSEIPELTDVSVTASKEGRSLSARVTARIRSGTELVGQVQASLSAPAPGSNEVFATFAPHIRSR